MLVTIQNLQAGNRAFAGDTKALLPSENHHPTARVVPAPSWTDPLQEPYGTRKLDLEPLDV